MTTVVKQNGIGRFGERQKRLEAVDDIGSGRVTILKPHGLQSLVIISRLEKRLHVSNIVDATTQFPDFR